MIVKYTKKANSNENCSYDHMYKFVIIIRLILFQQLTLLFRLCHQYVLLFKTKTHIGGISWKDYCYNKTHFLVVEPAYIKLFDII